VVLQRLVNASPADRIPKALPALGRACGTLFVLCDNYEERTRFAIQRQLKRGEARHSLAHWLFFANRGEFRVGDYEEVTSKASCLGLLSNAAMLWNMVQIGCVVGRLRAGGAGIDLADLAHVWPLQHARIIPNVTYFLGWPQDEMSEAASAGSAKRSPWTWGAGSRGTESSNQHKPQQARFAGQRCLHGLVHASGGPRPGRRKLPAPRINGWFSALLPPFRAGTRPSVIGAVPEPTGPEALSEELCSCTRRHRCAVSTR
jgi:hypothetical protein